MKPYLQFRAYLGLFGLLLLGAICLVGFTTVTNRAQAPFDQTIDAYAANTLTEGRETFRFDTFGSEAFWGDTLRLHEAVKGEALGGVGPGVSPETALAVGLKVDVDALPESITAALANGEVDLSDPAVTVALLELDAVVGVQGFFDDEGDLTSMGITCSFCHANVDDSFAPGIGHRLDGWANRDLNVGAIVSLAPNLQPVADRLEVDVDTLKTVFGSWGPGKYDAVVQHDGKAFRPDGESGATLIPPAFGLAGNNLHTWTGWGSVSYWNAYVANTQMQGQGTFYDPRLDDAEKYPVAAANGSGNLRPENDRVTEKLAALHLYQLAIPAPKPPDDFFDAEAAARGEMIFNEKAQCATCHVPPLFTEPGWNLHTPEEIGIDDFQASRSPDNGYRTTPLKGLWTHMDGGFYHDGRFATLLDVINHYDNHFQLELTADEKADLTEYLKSLGDAPIAAASTGSGPAAPQCTVVAKGLNLRDGPGLNYNPPIRPLPGGTEVQALARNAAATWIEVQVGDTDERGWVSAGTAYVSCNTPIADLPVGEIPPLPGS